MRDRVPATSFPQAPEVLHLLDRRVLFVVAAALGLFQLRLHLRRNHVAVLDHLADTV